MINKQLLSELPIKKTAICIGVKDSSSDFLQYLDKQKISLGSKIEIIEIEPFDQSYRIKINDYEITVTKKIANNLFVKTN
jgi:DtxR family Mn-dependent transcriptional regulator